MSEQKHIRIAIHHRERSFSENWASYCKENNIDFVMVNCHDTDILLQLEQQKITHLLWHVHHSVNADMLSFHNVLNSADNMGIKTFPNFASRWHFDDKVAQKFALESIKAPIVDTYVFFEEKDAEKFIENYTLPIVAKLKRGAGSSNVQLLYSKEEANNFISKMFTTGVSPIPKTFNDMNQKMRMVKSIKSPLHLMKRVKHYLIRRKKLSNFSAVEKGYVYFQKFLKQNDFDTRIVVIGEKAFGIIRLNRDNDFRASGSGKIEYDIAKIDVNMVKIAFDVCKNLGTQSLAFDFIYDENRQAKIIEISYAYSTRAYDKCEGYWTEDLQFLKKTVNAENFMIEDLIGG